jgi:hypothetical protein
MHRSRSRIEPGVFVGYLGLFWTKACVGESLGSFRLYLFYYALILYLLARNAFIYVHLDSLVQIICLLSRGVFSGHQDQWALLDKFEA